MKKTGIALFVIITIAIGISQYAQAQVTLSGSSVTTTGRILGWRGPTTAVAVNGVINTYYKVTAYTPPSGGTCATPATKPSMTVGASYGPSGPALAAGMEVLIIQMTASSSTGVINRTVSSGSYGDVSNVGGAGNYEFAYIDASYAGGSVIPFTKQLINTYDPVNAKVQLIPTNPEGTVANTANYSTANTLKAMEYDEVNGVGGVFVLSTSGTLTLNQDINLDGLGFHGGDTIGNAYTGSGATVAIGLACCGTNAASGPLMDATNRVLFAFPLVLTEARSGSLCNTTTNRITKACRKGRGIFGIYSGEEISKGKVGNGAGGAHGYNSGGGGGGGYSGGGNGGYEHDWACGTTPANIDHGGRGGVGFQGGSTALFMGGGGGAGHGDGTNGNPDINNTTCGFPIIAQDAYRGPSSGANGGGIVIIKASQIIASGSRTISAKGLTPVYSYQDGGGGGGGGGSIILEVPTYSGTLLLDARGGDGGSTINHNNSNCHGGGGGGGGGRVMLSVGSAPGGVTVNVNSGVGGKQLAVFSSGAGPSQQRWLCASTSTTCSAVTDYGTTAGVNGNTTLSATINTQTCVDSPTPVTLMSFYAELVNDNAVEVNWKTATEINSAYFVIEHSSDGVNFKQVGIVQANGNSQQVISYSFTDIETSSFSGTVYYRLRMVDTDGSFEYSKLTGIVLKGSVISIYPNPVKGTGGLNVRYYSYVNSEEITINIVNILGQNQLSKNIDLVKGSNEIHLSTQGLSAGVYIVEVNGKYEKTIQKVIVE